MTPSLPGQPLGLIEGFFGPSWPIEDRLAFAPFLRQVGFRFYLYAPKADSFLRKRWREPWPREFTEAIAGLSSHFRAHGLQFGVGLSPFGLHQLPSSEGKRALEEKVSRLEAAGLDWLGLFFDDMPVHDGLAQAQLEAIRVIRGATRARVLFCPTFYSPDPVLEKVFGKRPGSYWEEISQAPPEVDFAWTGPRVISELVPVPHLEETAALLGRKPFLWDNLFANDGPRNSRYLKLRPPEGRTSLALRASRGWAWNPMNQAALSRIVILACSLVLREGLAPEAALERATRESCSPALADFISRHRHEWLENGLDKTEEGRRRAWLADLRGWTEPAAVEIARWLEGAYAVGPECLTD